MKPVVYKTGCGAIISNTSFTLIAIDGRLVTQGSFTNRTNIDLSNSSAGIFHLQMQDHEGNLLYHQLISKQ